MGEIHPYRFDVRRKLHETIWEAHRHYKSARGLYTDDKYETPNPTTVTLLQHKEAYPKEATGYLHSTQ